MVARSREREKEREIEGQSEYALTDRQTVSPSVPPDRTRRRVVTPSCVAVVSGRYRGGGSLLL